jgi:hypothetical protein
MRCSKCGSDSLKGVAKPVELYRGLRPTAVRGRLAAARRPTPFVGREEELRLLLSRWETKDKGAAPLYVHQAARDPLPLSYDETPVGGRWAGGR